MATGTFRAPSASDYSAKVGYIVYKSGTGKEVTLAADGTTMPVGVIVAVENDSTGAVLTVAMSGERCFVRAGAAITLGTHNALMADADGEAIPATASNFSLGYVIAAVTGADNDWVECVVAPSWYEG